MKVYVPIVLLLLTAGCCSSLQDKALAKFRAKHPVDYRKFKYLNPVNLDTYRGIATFDYGFYGGHVAGWKTGFGSVPGVNEFAARVSHADAQEVKSWVNGFDQLEAASSGGGIVCQFEWSDGKTREVGLLAIKNGDIVKRDAWWEDYLSEQAPPSKPPNKTLHATAAPPGS